MVLMDYNAKGTRQSNIKHAPKTKPIKPISMKNVAHIVLFTLGLLLSLTNNLTNLGSI
jgi:hypothetical protein